MVSAEGIVSAVRDGLRSKVLEFKAPKPRRAYILVKPGAHRVAVSLLLERFKQVWISTITGIDLEGEIELNYHLWCNGAEVTVRTRAPKERPEIETITDLLPGATLYEREVFDLFGVVFKGHPDLRRLLLPEDWPKGQYPLRKDWSLSPEIEVDHSPSQPLESSSSSSKGPSVVKVVMGPQHPALHEPERFLFKVDGEVVVDVEPRLGYVHRGIEKAAEGLMFFQDVHLIERICGICNVAHGICFCQAVESIGNIQTPPRARYLRSIVGELNRIHSHLLLLGIAGLEIGFESLFQYMWRDREPILDLVEMFTGNRVMAEFNTIGGVRRDLSTELAEKSVKILEKLEERMRFYKTLFEEDPTSRIRTEGIGVLKKSDAQRLCVVGPVARGSGINMDVRKNDAYAAYDEIPFNVTVYKEGDSWARLIVRVDEILEGINIIKYAIRHLPSGPYRVIASRRQPEGEAVSRVEAPRGELIDYVKSNGTAYPERVKIRTPTLANILSFRDMVKGSYIADIPAALISLDPCFACCDRMAFLDVNSGRRWTWKMAEIRNKKMRSR